MANDEINAALRKSVAIMDSLEAGKGYQSDPLREKEENIDEAMALRSSVLKQLVGAGLDDKMSSSLMDDLHKRYPNNVSSIMNGLANGDLRYVSKDEYEAIKDRFPLMETK